MTSHRSSQLWRYTAAAVLTAVATLLTALIQGGDESTFFPFFLAAVGAAAALGGLGPGLAALGASTLVELLAFLEPIGTPEIADPEERARLAAFTVAGALLVLLAWRVRRAEASARAAREQVERFVSASPVGLAFVDHRMCLTHANEAIARLAGRAPEELLGRSVEKALPGQLGREIDAGLRRTFTSASASAETELGATIDGRQRSWRATFYSLPAPEGPAGAGVVLADVTERRAAEARARFLAEASGLLESPLSFADRLELLVRLVVPHMADAAMFEVPGAHGDDMDIAVLAHRDTRQEATLRRLRDALPLSASAPIGAARAMRTGRTISALDVASSGLDVERLVPDEELRADLVSLDVSSYVVVPLTARGRRLGALTLLATGARRFAPEDVPFAEELARRAALALDNVRLLERQTEIAHTLQQSLLPSTLPAIEGADLAARYRPVGEGLEVGGDFYDAFETPSGWLLSIGDVCGKGVTAATVTSMARHTIRALAFDQRSTSAVLTGLNESLAKEGARPTFLTCALVALRPEGDGLRATASMAGHPPPLVLRADGRVEPLGAPGTLIGPFVEELQFDERQTLLEPGDALVLYTDGVLEARAGAEFYGEERLRGLLEGSAGMDAHGLADRIEHDVAAFQRGEPTDDLALLVLRFAGVRAAAPQDRPR